MLRHSMHVLSSMLTAALVGWLCSQLLLELGAGIVCPRCCRTWSAMCRTWMLLQRMWRKQRKKLQKHEVVGGCHPALL